ncbi:MAG TPA: cytochrome b N-terminal domain-containing protein [Vicinamibacterales bacterium]|nr:cytochrome b N-terminal domain-containing protein [Vicinamibacterales bacterium]
MNARLRDLLAWLDDRTAFRTARHHLLDEPLPPGTGWWFTLGSVLLFGLTVQIVTGIALALFYAPTPDHAWESVRFVMTMIPGGAFLRGLHHWGASVVVVAAVVHLARVVFFGSYRKPRELNWIVGLILLHLILAFGLTGYLLPWDQRSYWATVVAINISKLTPLAGETVAALLRGGPDIGALTLTRWYAIHVLVLPPALVALVVLHLFLMRRQGISGPVRERAGKPFPFFPSQAGRDLLMAIAVGTLLAVLAWKGAPALEPPADPTASDYVPRPEWYFLGLFQLLKYFPGRLEVVGAIVIPGVAMTLLALLPWLDRASSRELRGRRMLLSMFSGGLALIATLTLLGARDKPRASTTGWNVRELAGASLMATENRCTRCHKADGLAAPIEAGHISRPADWLAAHVVDPEVIAPGLREPPETNQRDTAAIVAALARLRAEAPPTIDAAAAHLNVVVNRTCLGCHLIDGVGGTEGPDLSNVGSKYDLALIERRINNPVDVKPDAEMPAFAGRLTTEEIHAIAAWLAAKK